MRTLVTGAGGFIGRVVLSRLRRGGMDTLALLGPEDGPAERNQASMRGDVRDRGFVEECFDGIDAVVHLAGPSSVAASFTEPDLYASVHAAGTAVVCEAARRSGVSRTVLVSSAEIYGSQALQPVDESALPSPVSPYGAAKLSAELMARTILPAGHRTAVRPFSVYGPGMRLNSVIGRIGEQVRAGRPVSLQTLAPVRDYVHVEDLAELVFLCLASSQPLPEAMNACSGHGVSVGDLAAMMIGMAGRGGPVEQSTGTRRPADIPILIGDHRASLDFGWRGPRPLATGLADLLQRWAPDR